MHVRMIFSLLAIGAIVGAFRDRWDIFAGCAGVMIFLGIFFVEEGSDETDGSEEEE